MTIKVIGAGYGRTGTRSLKQALEMLGFDKCYHMEEVGHNPHHKQPWLDALEGKPVDWDALFEGYQSAVDFPAARYYDKLMTHYPDARVILTTRDPESWYASASETILNLPPRPVMAFLRVLSLFNDDLKMLMNIAPVARPLLAEEFNNDFSAESAIAAFNAHNDAVRNTVPAERLLV